MVRINKIKSVVSAQAKNFSVKKQGKSPYILQKAPEKIPMDKFDLDYNIWRIGGNSNADYYTHVKIGKRDDKAFNREIVSFYDSDNNLIKRCRIGNDINYQVRDYQYSVEYPKTYPATPQAKRRHIATKEWFKNHHMWMPVKEEDIFIYDIKSMPKNKTARKIHINKNVYDYSEDKTRIKASMTEYPTNFGLESQSAKKEASVELEMNDDIPKTKSLSHSQNVFLPQNDKFLPYRFLLENQKQISLGYECLESEGINNLGILVKISPSIVPDNSAAFFDSVNGNIFMKKIFRKAHPVGIAAHEADHAKRFSIIAQLGKRRTPFEQRAEKVLNKTDELEETKTALEYLIASENYPVIKSGEDLNNNLLYKNNLLEILALKKETQKISEYNTARSKYQEQFKYIAGENTL